jgi:hypothetical protein
MITSKKGMPETSNLLFSSNKKRRKQVANKNIQFDSCCFFSLIRKMPQKCFSSFPDYIPLLYGKMDVSYLIKAFSSFIMKGKNN